MAIRRLELQRTIGLLNIFRLHLPLGGQAVEMAGDKAGPFPVGQLRGACDIAKRKRSKVFQRRGLR